MSDIDFDELDKAVNSVMSKTPDSQLAATATADVSTEEAAEASSEPAATELQPSGVAVSSTPVSTPPLAKRRGRFMDVVHPSSDMKPAAKAPSREGVSVEAPATTVQPEATPASSSPSDAAPSAWPDPIDVHTTSTTDTGIAVDKTDGAAVEPSGDSTTDEPLSSPFLPDAKVEKRPLGGAAIAAELNKVLQTEDVSGPDPASAAPAPAQPAPSEDEPVKSESMTSDNAKKADSQLLPEEPTPLPAELDSDLVAIEAGDVTTTQPVKDEPQPQAPEQDSTSLPEREAEAPTATAATAPVAGSIPQQYKESPARSDENHTTIYDSDVHATPLAHPPKKKTGWLYLILILLILVLGAASGAAVYFLKLS